MSLAVISPFVIQPRTAVSAVEKSGQRYGHSASDFRRICSISRSASVLPVSFFRARTWCIRMTMLDGGNIKENFNFDDAGQPLSTAAGNMPDIECDYDDFSLSVEVTLQAGQRQYESEGEPVARHYGQLKKRTGKDTYCLFIAPTINPATLAHVYGLNHLSIALYGGKSKIVPLELDQFMKLIENLYNYETQPIPSDIWRFLDCAIKLCEKATDENHWRYGIQACVDMWLAS